MVNLTARGGEARRFGSNGERSGGDPASARTGVRRPGPGNRRARRNGLSACPAGPGEPRARADVRGTASGRRGEHRPCGPDRARPQAYLPMPSWIAPLPPLLFAEMVCRWTGATPRDPPFARAAKDAALEKSTHRRRAESSLRQRTPTRTVLPSNRTVKHLMGGSPTN